MTVEELTTTEVKAILNFITGGLSLMGCFWVFHFYFKTSSPRPVLLRLILCLSVSDCVYSVANVISPFDTLSSSVCTFEAVLRVFSVMPGLFWSTCIAILSYRAFTKGKGFNQELFFLRAIVLSIIIPIVFAIVPLIVPDYEYGVVTFGCYVVMTGSPTLGDRLVLILIFDGIPVMISLILTLGLYVLIAKKVKESFGLARQDISVQKLFWYPAVLFIAYISSFVDNVIELYGITSSESYTFTTIHIILTHSVGLTNALVYGLQRKRYYEACQKGRVKREQSISLVSPKTFEKSLTFSDDEGTPDTHKRSSYENDLIQASVMGSQ